MLGVIEMQIKKNPCGQGVNTSVNVVTSEGTPTISSILKTDHRADMLRPSSDISRGKNVNHINFYPVTLNTCLLTLTSVAFILLSNRFV
jgi:hypothetical protein